MAMAVRWYNGTPYLTEDAIQDSVVWYNAAPQIEYYDYEAASGAGILLFNNGLGGNSIDGNCNLIG